MSNARKKVVEEWAKDESDELANGGICSDEKITLDKPHQRRDKHPDGQFGDYDFGERGFWCESCHAKCTLGLSGSEYGHYKDCSHRKLERPPSR